MQITLPDDRGLLQRAHAAGFHSVEEFLLDLVAKDAEEGAAEARDDESAEEWVERFQAFLITLTSHNPNFDDSREAIYPVR